VFRITTPLNTNVSRAVRLGSSTTAANPAGVFNALRIRVEIESSLTDSVNGDFNFQLVFRTTQPGAAATSTTPAVPALAMIPTRWGIAMINGSSHPLDVHMWIPIERRQTGSVSSVFADFAPADVAFMVGSPAASAAAISVAASNSRLSWKTPSGDVGPIAGALGDITSFSSPGPLRDSSISPAKFYGVTHEINGVDVTAPGAMLQAARSAQSTSPANLTANAQSVMKAGTSMASPVVTGLVANLLAENPAMTMTDVMAKLKSASTIPATSAFQPPAGTPGPKPLSKDWGYGLVNAGLLK
jgi:subtilisin family serine protease